MTRPPSVLSGLSSGFRRRYGSGPWHLLALLACFALAGYVASLIVQVPQALRIGIWMVGAVILHDLVIWPAYTLLDRALNLRRRTQRRSLVPWVNHVRVPAIMSGCLLAVSFPLVLGWSGSTYRSATGLSPTPFTDRWLLVTAVLFWLSAVVYLARLAVSFRRRRQ